MVNFYQGNKSLIGKTAIITGANKGIGYETALEFAKRGCRTILACRNREKATEAQSKIIKATKNKDVIVKIVDVASLQSIRDFCKDINETESRLDILVNNAGVYETGRELSYDGFEKNMAVNYIAPFLLTNLLLDLLKKSAPSRIVNVSSVLAKYARSLDLKKLNEFGITYFLYAKTKLCLNLFTIELAKRLEGSGVSVFSLHPGVVRTKLMDRSLLSNALIKKFYLTPVEGAQTTIFCALQDGIEENSGQHFDNCKVVQPYGSVRKNMSKCEDLWNTTESLVELQ